MCCSVAARQLPLQAAVQQTDAKNCEDSSDLLNGYYYSNQFRLAVLVLMDEIIGRVLTVEGGSQNQLLWNVGDLIP